MKLTFGLVLALLLTVASSAFASDYYVSSAGSDALGDGSAANPYLTIQYAVNHVPDGTQNNVTLLHIGSGQFAETSNGTDGQLLISSRSYLTLTGTGAKLNGGTQITTQGYVKNYLNSGVLRVDNSSHIVVANLVVGDDRNWNDPNSFFQSTVAVSGVSDVTLKAAEILGPSQATLIAGGQNRAPTAVTAIDDASVLNLNNVLVNGHGSFLSNPRGEVHSQNVTIANLYGLGFDDHLMFLQEPNSRVNDRLYTFSDTIFYNTGGSIHINGAYGIAVAGGPNGGGVDNVYFDPSNTGAYDNLLVNALFDPNTSPQTYYNNSLLSNPLAFSRDPNGLVFASGVFNGNDPNSSLTNYLLANNGVSFGNVDGYDLVRLGGVNSGFYGGLATVPEPGSVACGLALFCSGAAWAARKRRRA